MESPVFLIELKGCFRRNVLKDILKGYEIETAIETF